MKLRDNQDKFKLILLFYCHVVYAQCKKYRDVFSRIIEAFEKSQRLSVLKLNLTYLQSLLCPSEQSHWKVI